MKYIHLTPIPDETERTQTYVYNTLPNSRCRLVILENDARRVRVTLRHDDRLSIELFDETSQELVGEWRESPPEAQQDASQKRQTTSGGLFGAQQAEKR
jgi:hypothetical protein